jgi:hypothetical protein
MTAAPPTLAADELPRSGLAARRPPRVPSSYPPLDRALGGGLAPASIACISGPRDDAGAISTVRNPPPYLAARTHTHTLTQRYVFTR